MLSRTSAGLAALIAALAVTSTATAATTANSSGKLVGFSYNAATKGGKLTLFSAKLGKTTYRVTAKTDCGMSTGQSGDQIACKSLGAGKYDRKPVRVKWSRAANGDRVAAMVVVDLS